MRRKSMFLVLALSLVVSLASIGLAANPVTLRLAHPSASTHSQHAAAEHFAKLVNDNSKGMVKIQIFPGSQLGAERDMNEGIQLGTIDMGFTSTGVLATFAPEMNIFNMPFLFRDEQHFIDVTTSDIGKALAATLENRGFIGLCFYGPSFRMPFNNRRPLNVPEDFKGLKFRTMEVPAHKDAYIALGASPTPMAYGEVYTGLQLKVIDGAENSWSYIYSQKFYEQAKYVSEVPIVCNALAFIASKRVWDKLPAEYRKAILDAIPETNKLLNDLFMAQEIEAKKLIVAAGVIVNTPPSVEPFIVATESVRKKYTADLPKEVQNLVTQIVNFKK